MTLADHSETSQDAKPSSASDAPSAPSVQHISAEGVRFSRAGRTLLSIDHVSFGHSRCSALVGPNGAGKSLLVRILCALVTPDNGRISWMGSAPDNQRRHRVGLLLQRPVLLRRTARQNISYALQISGMSHRQARLQADVVVDEAGLSAIAHVPAHRLSGGEQQRIALVRALSLKPDMLFLDEATANVDPASTSQIEQLLKAAMHSGLRVVMVSHDVGQVKRLADEVVLMNRGSIVEQNASEQFFEHSTNPVTRRWLAGELLV